MFDDIITLLDIDNDGTETRTSVLARRESVGQAEHYQAATVGLFPEMKFRLSDYMDYAGQRFVEFEGVRYVAERTYRTEFGEMELVVRR
ncbi:MAG: hypothetical protein U0N08_01785 [Oscillospiraceae bacterium]